MDHDHHGAPCAILKQSILKQSGGEGERESVRETAGKKTGKLENIGKKIKKSKMSRTKQNVTDPKNQTNTNEQSTQTKWEEPVGCYDTCHKQSNIGWHVPRVTRKAAHADTPPH